MKKIVPFFLLMIAAMSLTFAQTVVFSDNFDSYTVGSHLAQSNSAWTTWSNLPGTDQDGLISSARAASLPNSLYISGSTDQVYPFGNYATGHYIVSFNYFVPSTGNGAYFNIQHVLLNEWALGCNFYNHGSGYLKVGNNNYSFTYPIDEWFPIVLDFDMDNDQASLTLNDIAILTWPFHYQELDTNGTNQLAGINFYAGTPNNDAYGSGSYYVDDFTVTELSAAQIGEFAISSEGIHVSMNLGDTTTESFTMNNAGNGVTDFRVVTTYNIPNPNPTSTGVHTIKYCSETNANTWGWYNFDNAPVEIAIGYPSDSLQGHIGKTINEIDVYFTSPEVTTASVRVYAMGNSLLHPGPGELLYEQSFDPDSGWNYVQLTNPVLLDGSDLWIGTRFLHPIHTLPVAVDYGETNEFSGWTNTSSYWTRYNNNYLIMGKIDGTPITPWITVSPASGIINAGSDVSATVTVNSNGLAEDGTHTATLHCYSNCLDNSEVEIFVSLSVSDISVNEHNQIEVSVYPNPASDIVRISSDQIERVEIYNIMGQKVFDKFYDDSHIVIPTNGIAPGTYAVTVYTSGEKVTQQVIIK